MSKRNSSIKDNETSQRLLTNRHRYTFSDICTYIPIIVVHSCGWKYQAGSLDWSR